MAGGAEESSTDSATFPVEIAPKGLATPESKQEAQDALDAANKDTQKNLNDLKTTIDTVKAGKDGVKKFTEALNSKPEYKKQVEQILGLPGEPREDNEAIIGDIKTLQKALGVKEDGALGPNTFKELKVRWDARPQGQDYKTFIDGLIRPNAEKPATVTKPPESSITLNIQTPQAEAISPKMEENAKELRQDMESGMLRVGDEKINFELKGGIKTAFIDRDAYKIMNNADNSDSYELNIRAMEDNVIVKKEDIFTALEKGLLTIKGWTKPKKQGEKPKPVDLIINKEPIKQENKPDTVSSDATNSSKGLNIQTGDASKNADPENKDQVPSPVLNIQMDSVTSTVPEMKSDIVATIEASTTIQQANSAIPESKAIVA